MVRRFVLAFCLLWAAFAVRAETGISAAAFSPEWLALVHYREYGRTMRGTIASPEFYLSPEGRNDPLAELKATVELFRAGDNETRCRFPARYKLLKRLRLTDTAFPRCVEYEKFREDLQPAGATLIFTDAYMNNSSSLFGHTLLRIDTARKGTQLLSHGINYGAYTAGFEDSVFYAVYGLIGAYPGGFTVKPYYDVINTYNNLENRDIWEYQLDLSGEELDFLVAHVWEVGQTLTPYYFFTLNCSYMLMEVLDAVRPGMGLAGEFRFRTIPLDTVKAVNRQPNLVKSVNYRPSRRRKIQNRLQQMNREQRRVLLEMTVRQAGDDKSKPAGSPGLDRLNEQEQADVLETAYQYVQYQYVAGDLPLQEYRRRSHTLLKARNKLEAKPSFDSRTEGQNPVNAHDSMRFLAGGGFRNGNFFEQIAFRPAYHSLTDNGFGLMSGAEIDFMNVVLRRYEKENKFVLHRFDVLNLSSFSPVDEMFGAVSYRINLNVSRRLNPRNRRDGQVAETSIEGGAAYALGEHAFIYGLSGVNAAYGGMLPGNGSLGISFAAGIFAGCEKFGFRAEAKKIFADKRETSSLKLDVDFNYYLTRNLSAGIGFGYLQNHGADDRESLFYLNRYF